MFVIIVEWFKEVLIEVWMVDFVVVCEKVGVIFLESEFVLR